MTMRLFGIAASLSRHCDGAGGARSRPSNGRRDRQAHRALSGRRQCRQRRAHHRRQAAGKCWASPSSSKTRPVPAVMIAGEAFAKSAPDGYTLFVGANGPVLFAPEIDKRDAYNWKKDFLPITIDLDDAIGARGASVGRGKGPARNSSISPPRARQADDGLARCRHHQSFAQRTRYSRRSASNG